MVKFKYLEYLKEYGLYLGLVILGLGMMAWGGVRASMQTKTEQAPEFVPSAPRSSDKNVPTEVVVDIAGAVMLPGVYRLKAGSRVADVIVAAEGLSNEADEAYISRQINLAQVVNDGMKLYIPEKGEEIEAVVSDNHISINGATKSELEELWGIGEARAEAIIENRPYASIEELMSKANIPQTVIDKNQGKWGL